MLSKYILQILHFELIQTSSPVLFLGSATSSTRDTKDDFEWHESFSKGKTKKQLTLTFPFAASGCPIKEQPI